MSSRVVGWATSLLVPFVVMTPLTFLLQSYPQPGQFEDVAVVVMLLLSASVGFFVMRRRLPNLPLAVRIGYYPLMMAALWVYGFNIAVRIYGDTP